MVLSPNENRWDALVNAAALSEALDPAVVKAVIWNETRFAWVGDLHPVTMQTIIDPADLDREEPRIDDASVGVMQVLTGTGAWLYGRPVSREELRDPTFNIYAGTRMLSMLRHGWRPGPGGSRREGVSRPFDIAEVFAGYNGGPGMVDRRRADGTFPNQSYVDSALAAYAYFSAPAEPLPPGVPVPPPPATTRGATPGGLALFLLALMAGVVFLGGQSRS